MSRRLIDSRLKLACCLGLYAPVRPFLDRGQTLVWESRGLQKACWSVRSIFNGETVAGGDLVNRYHDNRGEISGDGLVMTYPNVYASSIRKPRHA